MDRSPDNGVLVVSADRSHAAQLAAALTRAGLRCRSADRAGDVPSILVATRHDVVVVDLGLDEPGLNLVADAARRGASVLVAAAPAFDARAASAALRLGAREFLTPPWSDAGAAVRAAFSSATRTDVEHGVQSMRSQIAVLERRFLEQMLAFEESQDTFYLDLARMMTIISNIMDGIVFADGDANIALMNPVAEDLLGIKSFMALGRTIDELAGTGDLLDALREDFTALRTRGEVNRTIEVHHSEQDLLYIKLHTSRVTDYRGCSAGILCVMQDITAEYKTDQLKNQYLSIVAHELRTPLTGIKTFSTMMAKGSLGKLSEQQQRVAESIREQSLRLEHQIDKLINLGHLESDENYGQDLELFGMRELVDQSVAPFEPVAADRRIALSVRYEAPDHWIEGDRVDLRRAMQAIVENAIKFTPDGGAVTVEVRDDEAGVRFSVRDTGPGIDPRYQRRIFEKFFQVEDPLTRHHGGAGLGLFFARGILEAHDSEIEVESELGKGACFSFVLRIADERHEELTKSLTGAVNTGQS